MLCQGRSDIGEGIDPAKSNGSKKCMIGHCWFFNHGFKFQDYVCNDCHGLTMLCLNISNSAIIMLKWLIIVVLFMTLANLNQFAICV